MNRSPTARPPARAAAAPSASSPPWTCPTRRRAVGSGRAAWDRAARFVKVGLELFSAAGPAGGAQTCAPPAGRSSSTSSSTTSPTRSPAAAPQRRAPRRHRCAPCTPRPAGAALEAAAEALADGAGRAPDGRRPALLAVTVLTSLGAGGTGRDRPVGRHASPSAWPRLARLAWDSGCDGLVCAAADLAALRRRAGRRAAGGHAGHPARPAAAATTRGASPPPREAPRRRRRFPGGRPPGDPGAPTRPRRWRRWRPNCVA